MKFAYLFMLLLVILSTGLTAFAQDSQEPRLNEDGFRLGFELGYQFLDGPGATSDRAAFMLSPEFNFDDWGIGFRFQLFLDVDTFTIPETEFDEFSDFTKIVKYIRYGKKAESNIYFRIGGLAGKTASIGHSTIVDHYYSEIDFDSRKIGLQFDWDEKIWGFETIVNSFTDWNVLGVRTYVRPFANNKSKLGRGLTIGVTYAGDFDAPESITKNEFGIAIIDEEKNLQYKPSSVNIIGIDIEMPVVKTNLMQIVPYFDFVQIFEFSHGFFAGLRSTFEIPVLGDILPIEFKLEWQELSSGFLPTYFNAFYEIERYNYPKTNSPTTKLKNLETADDTSGWLGSFQWGIKNLFWMRGSFSYYDNDVNRQKGFLILEAATEDYFNFNVMFIQRGIEDVDEMFKGSEKSVISASFGYPFKLANGQLIFGMTFERTWRLNQSTGHYVSIDSIMPYISYKLKFSDLPE